MSYVANENRYLRLINQLLTSEVGGETFCQEFCSLWKADRDEQYADRNSWAERYDLQLIEAHGRGDISSEEFERKWVELFGYAEYKHLLEMLDRIFTACDVFDPEPEREIDIDEPQLKSEVATHLAAYETAKTKQYS
jgi:hypothetical protein